MGSSFGGKTDTNLGRPLAAADEKDFDLAEKLFLQIVNGVLRQGPDPGMAGSLLYHMAMVTKMESETRVLLDELQAGMPNVSAKLSRIYSDFQKDAKELTKEITTYTLTAKK